VNTSAAMLAATRVVVTAAATTTPGPGGSEIPGWADDPAPVPPHVLPALHRHAATLGYTIYRVHPDDLPAGASGCTTHDDHLIRVSHALTPASTTRVLCHELGHAWHDVTGFAPPAPPLFWFVLYGEILPEEVTCELAAGIVTTTLGITTGTFTASYLAGREAMLPGITTDPGLTTTAQRIARNILATITAP
jgi:hypothetical protein